MHKLLSSAYKQARFADQLMANGLMVTCIVPKASQIQDSVYFHGVL